MTLMRNGESGAPSVKKLRDGLSRMFILLRPVLLKLEERHPGSSPSGALISSSVLLKVWKEPIPSPLVRNLSRFIRKHVSGCAGFRLCPDCMSATVVLGASRFQPVCVISWNQSCASFYLLSGLCRFLPLISQEWRARTRNTYWS